MMFEKGDKVRVKESAINGYLAEFRQKVKGGRIGSIRGYRMPVRPWDNPLVEFPAEGRRKAYCAIVSWRDLELVEKSSIEVKP
ncbi:MULTISPECIES: hypothetical protein [unclassified Pseudomonas]|uniref:hypothetical protein n=1 Tax=unclassified Pseudomonas TaxID=196821 RepID=UPI00115FDF00|nr:MULTISPECIES: hypothetical protein [unclassified Pseudomonas]